MGNTLKMDKIKVLRQLFETGWTDRKINRATGINRRTISKYRIKWDAEKRANAVIDYRNDHTGEPVTEVKYSNQNAPLSGGIKCPPGEVVYFEVPTDPLADPGRTSKSKVFIFDEQITKKLGLGQTARSIYQDLYLEEDYRGSYDSVKRYVRKLKNKHPQLYARIETPPGEEAQVDFGRGAPTLKNGRYLRPWLFVMTLSNSRKIFVTVVWSQDVETFIRCHEEAFLFFGGVPKIIKIDNLKSGVLKAHLYEPEINPNYQSLSEHYGFVVWPCRVRTPEHKGKVESGIKYVQNNALQGKRFESLDEQNAFLRHWNRTWATTRIHGTTKRQVGQMFKEEQPQLQPLPSKPFLFFSVGTRKVNSGDSHIEVKGAYYPVPPKYMGRQVVVHYNRKWVKVLYKGKTIQWLSAIEKGRFHPDKSCLPTNKAMDRNAWQKRLLKRCQVTGESVKAWADLAVVERGLPAYRSIQGVLTLQGKYSSRLLNQACSLAVERNAYSYNVVRQILEELSLQARTQTRLELTQEGEIIRPPKLYAQLLEEEVRS